MLKNNLEYKDIVDIINNIKASKIYLGGPSEDHLHSWLLWEATQRKIDTLLNQVRLIEKFINKCNMIGKPVKIKLDSFGSSNKPVYWFTIYNVEKAGVVIPKDLHFLVLADDFTDSYSCYFEDRNASLDFSNLDKPFYWLLNNNLEADKIKKNYMSLLDDIREYTNTLLNESVYKEMEKILISNKSSVWITSSNMNKIWLITRDLAVAFTMHCKLLGLNTNKLNISLNKLDYLYDVTHLDNKSYTEKYNNLNKMIQEDTAYLKNRTKLTEKVQKLTSESQLISEKQFNELTEYDKLDYLEDRLEALKYTDFEKMELNKENLEQFTKDMDINEFYHQLCVVNKFINKAAMIGMNIHIPVKVIKSYGDKYKIVFILRDFDKSLMIPKSLSFIEVDLNRVDTVIKAYNNLTLDVHNIDSVSTNTSLKNSAVYFQVCYICKNIENNRLILNNNAYKTFESVLYKEVQDRHKATYPLCKSSMDGGGLLIDLASDMKTAKSIINAHFRYLHKYEPELASKENDKIKYFYDKTNNLGDILKDIYDWLGTHKLDVSEISYENYVRKYYGQDEEYKSLSNITEAYNWLYKDYSKLLWDISHIE
jgi:hypothetical protein